MPTQEQIYKTDRETYHALIAREDYQENIWVVLPECAGVWRKQI